MKHHKLKILLITLVQFYFDVGTGFSLSVRNEEGFGQEVVGHEKQKQKIEMKNDFGKSQVPFSRFYFVI